MFESCVDLVAEYERGQQQLASPDVHGDQAAARQLGRRYAQLRPVVAAYREWVTASEDLEAAREFVVDDASFAEEVTSLEARTDLAAEKLTTLLLPRDPMDDKDVIVEVKAGEGGEESALFAGDLARMYMRYAERHGWTTEVLEAVESDLGGYKDIAIAVKAKGVPEPGHAPFARLKFEGGVHRVQRVPVTESQGRIHTSAAGVLVLPEAEDVDVTIDANDLRIDVYRSSDPAARASTRQTRQSASPTCPPGSWCPARTRRASSRTRSRRCASCGHGCWPWPRNRPRRRPPTSAAPRCAPSTQRAHPHLQLPREPAQRPPSGLQVAQFDCAGRRPRRGHRRAWPPTRPAGSARWERTDVVDGGSHHRRARHGPRRPLRCGAPAEGRWNTLTVRRRGSGSWRTPSARRAIGCSCRRP